MRESIRRLRPRIDTSRKDERDYASLNLGRLSRDEVGYFLEGPVFQTSKVDREEVHKVIAELISVANIAAGPHTVTIQRNVSAGRSPSC
jgi:hypothetical protein